MPELVRRAVTSLQPAAACLADDRRRFARPSQRQRLAGTPFGARPASLSLRGRRRGRGVRTRWPHGAEQADAGQRNDAQCEVPHGGIVIAALFLRQGGERPAGEIGRFPQIAKMSATPPSHPRPAAGLDENENNNDDEQSSLLCLFQTARIIACQKSVNPQAFFPKASPDVNNNDDDVNKQNDDDAVQENPRTGSGDQRPEPTPCFQTFAQNSPVRAASASFFQTLTRRQAPNPPTLSQGAPAGPGQSAARKRKSGFV